MKKQIRRMLIMFIMTCILSATVSAELGYVLELSNIDSAMVFSKVTITEAQFSPASLQKGESTVEQRDFSGVLTYKTSFVPPSGSFSLNTPYHTDTRDIIIRDETSKELLTIPVIQFADTCGNNICEPQESYETCSDDCISGSPDDYCDGESDNICDPDCKPQNDKDCIVEVQVTPGIIDSSRSEFERKPITSVRQKTNKKVVSFKTIILGGVGGVFIFFLVIIIIIVTVAKSRKETQLKEYVQKSLQQGYLFSQIEQTLLKSGYKKDEVEKVLNEIYKR